MAPRRGNGGFISGYGSHNPWNDEVQLTLDYYRDEYKSFFYASFAFDILSLIAFIVFFIWACTIRNRSLPVKSLIFALLSFLSSQVTQVVVEALYIASAEVKMYYVIALILQDFFFIIGVCITFHVFWNLIHTFLNRLTHPGKSYSALPILHWIFFSIALVLGLAKFALFTVMQIDYVNSRYRGIELSYYQLRGAMFIIYWVLSMEIMALVAFVLSKAGHRFISKMPAIALLVGAVSWFGVCFAWAIIFIRHGIIVNIPYPIYLDTAISVVRFCLWVGTFTGILLCCSKWRKLGDGPEKFTPVQYPSPQYSPDQFQSQHPAPYTPYTREEYPPTQQQPYGTAPYHDYSHQPDRH